MCASSAQRTVLLALAQGLIQKEVVELPSFPHVSKAKKKKKKKGHLQRDHFLLGSGHS